MIRKRKNSKNQPCYQVIIRDSDGHPAQYETFPTMQEAKDWEIRERARRRTETYFPEKIEQKHTLEDLINSYINLLKHLGKKSARDILESKIKKEIEPIHYFTGENEVAFDCIDIEPKEKTLPLIY